MRRLRPRRPAPPRVGLGLGMWPGHVICRWPGAAQVCAHKREFGRRATVKNQSDRALPASPGGQLATAGVTARGGWRMSAEVLFDNFFDLACH